MDDGSQDKSITEWIADWKQRGDQEAAQRLWERYYQRLVEQARRMLGAGPRRMADEEDVAAVAFNSLFLGAQQGRFPKLNDRDDLWQILLALAERKAADQRRRERRLKRGGGKVRGESGFAAANGSSDEPVREPMTVVGRNPEPSPEAAAITAEELERRLAQLPGQELRQVALWKLEGYTNREIAEKLGCIEQTVERKLKGIRDIWSKELRRESDVS